MIRSLFISSSILLILLCGCASSDDIEYNHTGSTTGFQTSGDIMQDPYLRNDLDNPSNAFKKTQVY